MQASTCLSDSGSDDYLVHSDGAANASGRSASGSPPVIIAATLRKPRLRQQTRKAHETWIQATGDDKVDPDERPLLCIEGPPAEPSAKRQSLDNDIERSLAITSAPLWLQEVVHATVMGTAVRDRQQSPEPLEPSRDRSAMAYLLAAGVSCNNEMEELRKEREAHTVVKQDHAHIESEHALPICV